MNESISLEVPSRISPQNHYGTKDRVAIPMSFVNKADWLTRYLVSQNSWVGGLQHTTSNGSPELIETIRYFKGAKQKFIIVLILENWIDDYPLSKYEDYIQKRLLHYPVLFDFVLIVSPKKTNPFAIYNHTRFFDNLNSSAVLTHFANLDESIVGTARTLKPINTSFTDFFHQWARQHMKGFQNDIDAIYTKDKKALLIELKRPKESVASWKPYKADRANYHQISLLSESRNLDHIIIAYSELEHGVVKAIKELDTSKLNLTYKHCLIKFNPEDALLELIHTKEYSREVSLR